MASVTGMPPATPMSLMRTGHRDGPYGSIQARATELVKAWMVGGWLASVDVTERTRSGYGPEAAMHPAEGLASFGTSQIAGSR
jgi:hypothetical protein